MPKTNTAVQAEVAAHEQDLGLISKGAICALARVSPRYVDGLVKAGRLGQPIRLSHKVVRFRVADVKRFFAEQGSAAA